MRIHEVKEIQGNSTLRVLELVIINSAVLKGSKADFEECLQIAKMYHRAMENKARCNGIRVILSGHGDTRLVLSLSRNYYYDRSLLH